jgi:hypothetical protein
MVGMRGENTTRETKLRKNIPVRKRMGTRRSPTDIGSGQLFGSTGILFSPREGCV